mgnify:FL=1
MTPYVPRPGSIAEKGVAYLFEITGTETVVRHTFKVAGPT